MSSIVTLILFIMNYFLYTFDQKQHSVNGYLYSASLSRDTVVAPWRANFENKYIIAILLFIIDNTYMQLWIMCYGNAVMNTQLYLFHFKPIFHFYTPWKL